MQRPLPMGARRATPLWLDQIGVAGSQERVGQSDHGDVAPFIVTAPQQYERMETVTKTKQKILLS